MYVTTILLTSETEPDPYLIRTVLLAMGYTMQAGMVEEVRVEQEDVVAEAEMILRGEEG